MNDRLTIKGGPLCEDPCPTFQLGVARCDVCKEESLALLAETSGGEYPEQIICIDCLSECEQAWRRGSRGAFAPSGEMG